MCKADINNAVTDTQPTDQQQQIICIYENISWHYITDWSQKSNEELVSLVCYEWRNVYNAVVLRLRWSRKCAFIHRK